MGYNYDELAVKYGGLDALSTEIGNQAKKLDEDLRALKAAVQHSAEGWQGEGANAFAGKAKEWDAHVTGIHTALTQLTGMIHQAGGDYRGGDLKAASYFQD